MVILRNNKAPNRRSETLFVLQVALTIMVVSRVVFLATSLEIQRNIEWWWQSTMEQRFLVGTKTSLAKPFQPQKFVNCINILEGIGFGFHNNDPSELANIQLVTNWGLHMDNDVKIPSIISYSPCTGDDQQQFGASISPDAVAMVNTKLELEAQDTRLEELDLIVQVLEGMKDLNFEYVRRAQGYPGYTWKTPEDIVTDYLTKAFEHFEKATEYLTEIKSTVPVDIIITVPVVCLSSPLIMGFQAHIKLDLVLQSKELHIQGCQKRRI
jgi:hypothetical protein